MREFRREKLPQLIISLLLMAALLTPVVLSGCTGDMGDINRTSPDRVEKSIFQGLWFYRPTTIYAPYSVGFTFVGEQPLIGLSPKIIWDIQEKYLIGYNIYSLVKNAEEQYQRRRLRRPDGSWVEIYVGSPVAIFPIKKHFDVIRAFNTTSGEQSNVITEDSSLKPWYQRKYMRVDWSVNKAKPLRIMMMSAELDGTANYIRANEDQNMSKPIFSKDYIEFTGWIGINPKGNRCSYYYHHDATCSSARWQVRHSFKKAGPTFQGQFCEPVQGDGRCDYLGFKNYRCVADQEGSESGECFLECENDLGCGQSYQCVQGMCENTYEAWNYDPYLQDKYGYFISERKTYHRQRGMSESGKKYFINRWNLWTKTKNPDGTKLTFRQRIEGGFYKPVLFYNSVNMPQYLWETSYLVGQDWNKVFKDTVAWMIYLEEKEGLLKDVMLNDKFKILSDKQLADFQKEVDDIKNRLPAFFAVCPNRWQDVLDAKGQAPAYWQNTICRNLPDKDKVKKVGDIRYSLINWVGSPMYSGPLGYGPSDKDPETGEIFTGTANIYGASLEAYASYAMDIINLLNNNIKPEDLISGKVTRDDVATSKGKSTSPLTATEVEDHKNPMAGIDHDLAMRLRNSTALTQQKEKAACIHNHFNPSEHFSNPKIAELHKMMRNPLNEMRQLLMAAPQVRPDAKARGLEPIKGTPIEDRLINEEVRFMFGQQEDRGKMLDEQERANLSPARWAHFGELDRYRKWQNTLMANNVYHITFTDDTVYGLAKEMQEKQKKNGWSSDQVREEVIKRVYMGVTIHEIGHTVGLRHNFGASADAYNFFDKWYDIKGNFTNPDAPVTEQQKRLKIYEYQYSSIMDYGARFNSDFNGAGKYDRAVIKFGYGGLVEVFGKRTAFPVVTWARNTMNMRSAGIVYHIFSYMQIFGGNEGWKNFLDKNRLTLRWNDVQAHQQKMYSQYFKDPEIINDRIATLKNKDADSINDAYGAWEMIEVPFRYCGDEFRGNLGCNVWDQGFDASSIVDTALNSLDKYYIFDAFMRDRYSFGKFGSYSYYYYRLGRYYDFLRSANLYASLYKNYISQIMPQGQAQNWEYDKMQGGMLMRGLQKSVNYFSKAMASPSPGGHFLNQNVFEPITPFTSTAGQQTVDIPLGIGRYPFTRFMDDTYFYAYRAKWIGSFWDKLYALMTLTNSRAYFAGGEFSSELAGITGGAAVGVFTVYPKLVTNILGGLITDTYQIFAGTWDAQKQNYTSLDMFSPSFMTGKPVKPSITNMTLKLYAGLYGLANLAAGYDQSFIDSMALYIKGNSHEFENWNPDPAQFKNPMEFKDPFTGKIYVAPHHRHDGRIAISYTMLQKAQSLVNMYNSAGTFTQKTEYRSQLREILALLDYYHYLYKFYGYVN